MDISGGLSQEYLDSYNKQTQTNPNLEKNPYVISSSLNGRDYNAVGDFLGFTPVQASTTSTASTGPSYADFMGQQNNLMTSARDRANQGGSDYNSGLQTMIYDQRQAQKGLDRTGVQNELSKMQGVQGVLGMVGRGIKSSGVTLANKNAGDSSAAQGLADAYGVLGKNQLSGIGNQYEAANSALQASQSDLAGALAENIRKSNENKDKIVNQIVADTQAQLATLDTAMMNASLPNRINMEQEKANIKAYALNQLQQYDAQFNNEINNIKASSLDTRRQSANTAMQAGQNLGQNQFNYTTEMPVSMRNTGPMASSFPLYTRRGNDQTVGA